MIAGIDLVVIVLNSPYCGKLKAEVVLLFLLFFPAKLETMAEMKPLPFNLADARLHWMGLEEQRH